ncbi:MAG TPA: AMIN domain-containing protein, partial [Thermoanaerobaculia bacterium]|nr:AMIN domain-containing protein [Thermoanaerobaculia bacterium]
MACRRGAIAITTLMMAAVFGCASSTGGRGAQPTDGAPAPAASSPAAASHGGSTVQGAAFNEDSDGARLVLSSDAPLLYTAYEPRPDTLVVDLPGSTLSDHFVAPSASGDLVTAVHVEPITEMGKHLTRLTIAHKEGARYDVHTVGQGLAVTFDTASTTASAETLAAPPPAAAPAVSAAPAQPAPAPVVAKAAAPAPAAPARVEIAHVLEEVRVASAHGELTVSLLGDGALQARDFTLENPPRIVIDLPGIKNEVRKRVIPASGGQVSRIRISQFQTSPDLVTRVVIDLTRPTPHAVQADGERVAIVVGRTGATAAAAQAEPARTTIASEPAHLVDVKPEPAAPAPAVAEVSSSAAPPPHPAEAAVPPAQTKAAEMKPPAETPAAVKPATEVNPPPAQPP